MSGVALTDSEWNFVKNRFPLVANSRDELRKTDDVTRRYNCVAWSLGITDEWINPPQPQAAFNAFYKSKGYEPGTISQSIIDSYLNNGRVTHVSRNDAGSWSSKLGGNIRMIHPRYELQGSSYGFIEVFFTAGPAQMSTSASVATAPPAEADKLAANATTKVASLVERYAEAFPALAASFDQNWDAWQKTWDNPKNEIIQSSDGFAQGPEWDALVAMGTAILPQVVAKLQSDANIFGCDLYNELQTDPTKKVDPGDLDNYWVLNNQAKAIVKLYGAQAASFESLATDWATAHGVKSRSSESSSFASGPAYEAIRDMGKAAVPFIMDMYARDQDGWWHELLFEIEHGVKSYAKAFDKPALYKHWYNKFQGVAIMAQRSLL